jgi:CSLREA domain-containing protein
VVTSITPRFRTKPTNRTIYWIFGVLFAFMSASALGETFTVVTTDDDSSFTPCDVNHNCESFRAAVFAANQSPDPDIIHFNIPGGGVQTITLVAPLPPIINPVWIDGYSQPDSVRNTNPTSLGLNTELLIELDGSFFQSGTELNAGLEIEASDCIIEGLAITNFLSRGIFLHGGSNNLIRGNFIGVEADGVTAAPNGVGIGILDSSSNAIGEAFFAESRNLISGNNGDGISISGVTSVNNKIETNLIGTDITGLAPLGNARGILLTSLVGVDSYAADNVIGGADNNFRNIISGNKGPGIYILRGELNKVSANYIGLNVSGDKSLHNGAAGVLIDEGSGNEIGGSSSGKRNVISGNLGAGIEINAGWLADNPDSGGELQRDATGNLIYGNYIGTDQSGLESTPNGVAGVLISSKNENTFKAQDNAIGNVAVDGSGNLISGNFGPGIQLDGNNTLKTLVQRNRIGLSGNDVTPLGNETHGVHIRAGSSENVIGSKFEPDEEEAKNIIANNGGGRFSLTFPYVEYNDKGFKLFGHGVFVEKGTKNTIRLNSIYANEGRAIDLGEDYTFTVNDPRVKSSDPYDSDTGANNLQNFPVAISVYINGDKFIDWELNHKNTLANNIVSFKLDFYANNMPDPSGFGEGRRYIFTHRFSDTIGANRKQINTSFPLSDLNISATATDSDGNTSEFSMVDTDGDAIADTWETSGIGLDINEDGKSDLNLSDYGASPDHRDIFLEIDGMQDRLPNAISKLMVWTAFANAPVDNPDGNSGIVLHMPDGGDTNIPRETWSNDDKNLVWPTDAYEQMKNGPTGGDFSTGKFGTPADRLDDNWPFIRLAKRLVFHYAFMADIFSGEDAKGDPDTGSGAAESGGGMGGNDIYLALGNWRTNGGSIQDRAVVLMHELGHNLGLGHGGKSSFASDRTNFKPNYRSLMNYTWQNERIWMRELDKNNNGVFDAGETKLNNNNTFDRMHRLDFSHVAYGPYGSPPDEKAFLNEATLDENEGIKGQADSWVLIGPHSVPGKLVPETGSVDWNQKMGSSENSVDVPGINNPRSGGTAVFEQLVGREDWTQLRYYFLESPSMNDHAYTPPPEPELTYEDELELNSLGIENGILRFKYDIFETNESVGSATITITRGGGTVGTVTVDYTTVDGSAIANADFTPVSGTLTFLEGEYLQTFEVPIIQDGIEEQTENLQLVLSNPTGGALVFTEDESSELQIKDDDGAGTIQFSRSYLNVLETDGIVNIEVIRTEGFEGSVTVDYSTIDGTTTSGQDYLPVSGTLDFAPGQSTANISVTLLPDLQEEITELLILNLFSPTGSSSLGDLSSIDINIIDAPVTAGVLQFENAIYEVVENGASVGITVIRSGTTEGAVTVDYVSSNDTATAGADYSSVSGTLNFVDGQASASFTVPILDDGDSEGNEIFVLTLSNATGGAGINSPQQVNVHIIDDEGAGTIQFSAATYSVSEDAGSITIDVTRTGSDSGEVSVNYATFDASAVAGSDYISTSGTLIFPNGQSSASFSVSIIDDAQAEFDESLEVMLTNPGGGVILGVLSTSSLQIIDDQAPLVVTNTNDSGPGSLRAAITTANGSSSRDLITFDIPGAGVHRIVLYTSLPTITSPVLIDGYSQPGAQANSSEVGSNAKLLVELGVANRIGMIILEASDSTIRGLAFQTLFTRNVNGNTLTFRETSIFLKGSASNNRITGNFIGTNAAGSCVGKRLNGGNISDNTSGDGGNIIGGGLLEERNVIGCGASVGAGRGGGVYGNLIGVGIDGVTSIESSEGDGVTLLETNKSGVSAGGPGTEIGRVEPGWGNVIAFHARNGVQINAFGDAGNVSIRGNSIYSNTRMDDVFVYGRQIVGGISTVNNPWLVYDITESDLAQNAPILNSAITGLAGTLIKGALFSTPDSTFILDFYQNTNAHVTGYGEGKKYLASTTVGTDANGQVDFDFLIPNGIPQGQLIVATAKYAARGTSTFSARIAVGDVLESPFVVNSDDDEDDGSCSIIHCSLREAIHAANNKPGADSIHFNIDTGVQTISARFDLPQILESVLIDGTTQPGFSGSPLIQLQGKYKGNYSLNEWQVTRLGLAVHGSDTTVRGLVINQFSTGVFLSGEGNHRVVGNFIGTDATGSLPKENLSGILILSSLGNLIGGTVAADRNIISGNAFEGIKVSSHNTRIEGNYIGTDVTGMNSVGGQRPGIKDITQSSEFDQTMIGGLAPGAGNVISGNQTGIEIGQETVVQGNLIGMNADCSAILSNSSFGIATTGGAVSNQVGSLIGGLDPMARNVISGNRGGGIQILKRLTGKIQGNYIGVGCDGSTLFGNLKHGIETRIASGQEIGGTAPGAGNIIAGNAKAGVAVITSSTGIQIQGNAIFANQALGIDLADNGVTANDLGDADSGQNLLQNYPVITNAQGSAQSTFVTGTLNAASDSVFHVEFFSNSTNDPSGFGQGENFLGNRSVLTDTDGNATFSATFLYFVPIGANVTATATDAEGNTSEFSALFTVGAATNNPPVALDDGAITAINTAVTVDVLANDEGIDGSLVTDSVFVINTASNGSTQIDTATGSITYTPMPEFSGMDSFGYTVEDSLGAESNIATVSITIPPANIYSIGGNLTGLEGSGLTLQNNLVDDLVITANGSFIFATLLVNGSDYAVSVLQQPSMPDQICVVSSSSGVIAGSDITDVIVTCTSGSGIFSDSFEDGL